MKKLLLVAALPLLLVGCATEENINWKEVKQNEYIEVYFGTTSKSYYGSENAELKYKVVAHESVTEVFVVKTYQEKIYTNDYYIGTNITVYHYEV